MTADQPQPAEGTPSDERAYVLGTGDDELDRLGFQNGLWSAQAHALWERAAIRRGMTVLDIGCGPGFAALDLARLVGPTGCVVGVDASARFVDAFNARATAAGLANTRAYCADVADMAPVLPVERAGVDLAYARWLFCFVPNPSAVLRSAAHLLKPGGRLLVQDYFNYTAMTTAPRSDAFDRVINATARSWRETGGNPDVMGDLARLAEEAGLRVEHIDVHQRLARPGSMMWQWPKTFWTNFIPQLIEGGFLTHEDGEAFHADLDRLHETEHAYIVLPAVYEMIFVKPR